MDGITSGQSFIGRQVSHYKIVQLLGAGGMGVVYQATDLKLDRNVALKFLPAQFCYDERLKQRLIQEAKAASGLDHNNLGTIHGIEETQDGQLFIVMAFYDGETISSKIKRGPLQLTEAIDFAAQIASGLFAAHQRGIIHRDIKSSNVIVTTPGIAKIVDFGLARFGDGIGLTQTGAIVGTAAYMSPEQAQGHPLDARTDLWSAGVVLYEMLTGALPFGGSSLPSVLNAVISTPAPDLPPGLPPALSDIVQRALSKDLAGRYATAADMLRDLGALAATLSALERTQTIVTMPSQAGARPTRRSSKPSFLTGSILGRRLRRRTVVGSLVVLLLLSPAVFLPPTARQRFATWINVGQPATVRRLVVLPFTNLGNDSANASLCDGLVEVLTSKLTSFERLQSSLSVVPASEVRRRKVNSPEDAQKQFKANLVVSGSVQRDGAALRLSIALIDATDVRQIGSAVLQEADGNFSTIQDAAIAKLAELLGVNTKPDPLQTNSKDGSAVPAAYESYLKGVGMLQRYDKPENLDGAIALFQQTSKTDPKFALAYAKLGEAYRLKYRIDKDPLSLRAAQTNSDRAVGLNPQLPTPYVTLGFIHDATGQHELAVQEFQHALQLDERNTDAYQGLARAYESVGRTKDAEAMYQNAIALDPDAWDAHNRLGAFYNRQGRFQDAMAQFRRVVQIAPDNSLGYINVGALLFRNGQPEEAAEMYKKSLGLVPSYVAYANLGSLYFKDRKYAESAGIYEKALQMNDKDFRVWRNLAYAYQKLSDLRTNATFERAIKAAEQFLRANSQDPEAIGDLADMKLAVGQKQEAERLISRATALAPADPAVLLKAADVYELLGDRDRALDSLVAALKHGLPKADVLHETDLQKLRNDPRFPSIMAHGSESRP
jgi:Serine/threonine protein kinase